MALIFTPYYYIYIRSFRLVLSFGPFVCSYLNPTTANPNPQPNNPPPRHLIGLTLTPRHLDTLLLYTPKNNTHINIALFFLCPKNYHTKNENASHFLFSNPKSKTISETQTDLETQRAGGSRIGITTWNVLRNM